MVTRRMMCKLLGFVVVGAGLGVDPLGLLSVARVQAAPIQPASSTNWVARHGLTASQYQQEFDRHAAAGFSVTYVSGYNEGGQARYAAIWDKLPSAPAQAARIPERPPGRLSPDDPLRLSSGRAFAPEP